MCVPEQDVQCFKVAGYESRFMKYISIQFLVQNSSQYNEPTGSECMQEKPWKYRRIWLLGACTYWDNGKIICAT